ncbi:transporter [Ruminococcus sp. OA3]|uniref:transporter n=1 Tax=Ruminococcus sp. OA3 TaxID=2914164 RepID=UPI001F05B1D8|nr:transporter [Ruminococcus sp. OA3]MCH1981413.1 transporter [Ruminococcus sp. OA3]
MVTFYNICIGLTIGVLLGFTAGGLKWAFGRKSYSDERVKATKKLTGIAANILKYVTFLLLVLGLIWCAYFLVLGIVTPERSDYANNMAELVVAVLSVISIIFAFVEFLRRQDDKQ